MGLSWSMTLDDGVSGPASTAAAALSRLSSAFLKAGKAANGGGLSAANDQAEKLAKTTAGKADAAEAKKAAKAEAAQQRTAEKAQAQAEKAAGKELAAMAKRQLKAEEQAVKAAERTAAKAAKAADRQAAKGGGNAGAKTRVQTPHGSANMAELVAGLPGVSSAQARIESFVSILQKVQGVFAKTAPAAAEASESIAATGEAAASAGGPYTMIAAAYLAAAAAAIVLVGAGAALALSMSEAREKSVLAFDALSAGGHGGAQTLAMLSRLGQVLPQATGQLKTWAKELMGAGTTDLSTLESRVKAIASAEALMGEDGAAAAAKVSAVFQKIAMAEQTGKKLKDADKLLKDTGVTASEVAAKLGMPVSKLNAAIKAGSVDAKKFGDAMSAALIEKGKGPLEAMSLSLDTVRTKVMGAFLGMFTGVDVKPFLKGVKEIGDVLIKVMGGEGKASVSSFFTAFFVAATAVLPLVKGGILAIAAAVKFLGPYAALAVAGFKVLFDKVGGAATLTMAFKGLAVVLGFVALAAAICVAPFLLIFAVVAAATAVVVGIVGVLAVAAGALLDFAGTVTSALADAIGAGADAGANIVKGIADGITSNTAWVEAAVAGMGSSIIAATKRVLGIASPSKVMAQLGGHTAEGFAQGVEDHPGPQAAMAAAVAPPSAAVGSGKDAAGGRSFTIGDVHITVTGGGDADSTGRKIAVSFVQQIEDLIDQMGHSPEPA